MIVFIATVLVSAVAAAVVLTTASELDEKSRRTGKEVSAEVATNLQVDQINGKRLTSASNVSEMDLTLSLSAGSEPMDLREVAMQLRASSGLKTVTYVDGAAVAGKFNASEILDTDGSFNSSVPVLNQGDVVLAHIDLGAMGLSVGPHDEFGVLLIPSRGSRVLADFRAPETFGSQLVVELR